MTQKWHKKHKNGKMWWDSHMAICGQYKCVSKCFVAFFFCGCGKSWKVELLHRFFSNNKMGVFVSRDFTVNFSVILICSKFAVSQKYPLNVCCFLNTWYVSQHFFIYLIEINSSLIQYLKNSNKVHVQIPKLSRPTSNIKAIQISLNTKTFQTSHKITSEDLKMCLEKMGQRLHGNFINIF